MALLALTFVERLDFGARGKTCPFKKIKYDFLVLEYNFERIWKVRDFFL